MEDMSTTAGTGDLALAFGDFSKGYGITDRVGMRILRDPYTKRPNIAYYTTKRVGGGIMDSNAIKVMQVS
jgi:HK97 family phage major capsid protein